MRQSLKDSLIKECAFLDPKKVNALPLHLSLAKKNEKYTSDEKKKYVAALQGLKLAQEYNNMHSPALLRDGTLLATFSQQMSPVEQLQTLVAQATFTPQSAIVCVRTNLKLKTICNGHLISCCN